MKKIIKNCFTTTGLSLVMLAIVASLYNGQCIFVKTVYECLAVNIFIHIGLLVLQKFESKYFLLEVFIEVSYILIILISFGFVFQWYGSTPLWVLVIMGISMYTISTIIDSIKINHDVTFINEQLKKRKEKRNV